MPFKFWTGYKLLKSNFECGSDEEKLGNFSSLQECGQACRNKDGCNFFIFGESSSKKEESCYWEKASAGDCTEGWVNDTYDFYELSSMFSFSNFFSYQRNSGYELRYKWNIMFVGNGYQRKKNHECAERDGTQMASDKGDARRQCREDNECKGFEQYNCKGPYYRCTSTEIRESNLHCVFVKGISSSECSILKII